MDSSPRTKMYSMMIEQYLVQPLALCCLSVCIALYLFFYGQGKTRSCRVPPGPKPLPLLGNLLQLTGKPHRALASLASAYGPLMYLRLGSADTVVVSSSAVAREVFLKHDLALSSRTVPDAARALDHHLYSVGWISVSPLWRSLRKISTIHLFTSKQLDATRCLRHRKVREMVEHVRCCSREGRAVEVPELASTTSLNLLWNTFFSSDMAGYDSAAAQELKRLIRNIFDSSGKPNPSDFFPWLRLLDPLGVRRDTAHYFSKLFTVFDDIITMRMSSNSEDKDDLLQTLLQIIKQDDYDLTYSHIKHLLLDMISAGTDTTSSTVEWAMTELLCNPSKLEKAQSELCQILGPDSLTVEERDIERLPYLQAVVKETMRLHPSAPLLLPRKAENDVELCGYVVRKGTQVLVNAWAIGRDPKTWKSPSDFMPERFLGTDIDVKGRDFELIPFGAGRRICLGMPLAHRIIHLMLVALLQGFSWRLPDGLNKKDVDMDEKLGITLQKAVPLLALPLPKFSDQIVERPNI